MMLSKEVKEWLAEYKILAKEEVHTYAASVRHNSELVTSLHALFDEHPSAEILDPVCHQLFEFYRSNEKELQRFALELVPALIWLYLSFVSKGDKNSCSGVEAFLLSVYNLETCSSDGTPKVKKFRIPSFAKHSIYHEPQKLSSVPLQESALRRYSAEAEEFQDGPHPQYESINGQNRHTVLAYLLQCYHGDISNLSSRSHKIFCRMCSRIVTTGFNTLVQTDDDDSEDIIRMASFSQTLKRRDQSGELHSRISVSPALLIDMLSCLYYIMFNGQTSAGAQAVVDIHYRACFELFPDVLLVTNAIRNSLKESGAGQPDDGTFGLSLAMSPASSNYTLSKTAITNASFRATKLPEDIPLQPDESVSRLATIEEDETTSKGAKGLLGKLTKKDKMPSKSKEINVKSSLSNGDSSDSVQVAIGRGQQRSVVDTIEMTSYGRKDTESNSSPFQGKHGFLVSAANSKLSSVMKSAISNKDVKSAKINSSTGHSRELSGSSLGSESFSTDL